MSKEIAVINERIAVTQFAGPATEEDRRQIQITELRALALNRYVQLTREEVSTLIIVLNKWLVNIGDTPPF